MQEVLSRLASIRNNNTDCVYACLRHHPTGLVWSFLTQLFLQKSLPPTTLAAPAQPAVAALCLQLLDRASPTAWLEESAELSAVVTDFVTAHQSSNSTTVWLMLPAATNLDHVVQSSIDLSASPRSQAVQPSVALSLVLSLLLEQSKKLSKAEPHKSAEQHLEIQLSSSDAEKLLCSMLLILQVLIILTRKEEVRHTANQAMVLSTVLSNVAQNLVKTAAQHCFQLSHQASTLTLSREFCNS